MKIETKIFNRDFDNSVIRSVLANYLLLKENLAVKLIEKSNPKISYELKCKNYKKLKELEFFGRDGVLFDVATGKEICDLEIKTAGKISFTGYSKIDEFNKYNNDKIFILYCVDEKESNLKEQMKRIVICRKKDLIIKETILANEKNTSRDSYRLSFIKGQILYDWKMYNLIGSRDWCNNICTPIRDNVKKFFGVII